MQGFFRAKSNDGRHDEEKVPLSFPPGFLRQYRFSGLPAHPSTWIVESVNAFHHAEKFAGCV